MKPSDIFRLILLAAVWGSSYLFMKLVAPVIGISLTMSTRVVIAAGFLLVIAAFTKQLPQVKKFGWQYLFLGLFNLVVPTALMVYSVMNLGASIGAILNSTTPLFTVIIARIWLKEKLVATRIAGLLLGSAGIVVIMGWNTMQITPEVLLSFAASLTAALCFGISTVFSRKQFAGFSPMQTAAGQMAGAAVAVLPLLIFQYDSIIFTPSIFVPLATLGIVCTGLAFILYFKSISSIGPVNTSIVTIIVPVFSIIWSVIFLGESVTPGMLAGLALIIAALYLVLYAGNLKFHFNFRKVAKDNKPEVIIEKPAAERKVLYFPRRHMMTPDHCKVL